MGLTPKRLLLAGFTLVAGLVAVALLLLALSSPFETLALYDVEGDVLSDQSAEPVHSEVWTRFNEIFPADQAWASPTKAPQLLRFGQIAERRDEVRDGH